VLGGDDGLVVCVLGSGDDGLVVCMLGVDDGLVVCDDCSLV
jgi:hypothetical protein